MSRKYTIEEKVENFFESLEPRYKPFQMHQFCSVCGRDLHRSQFKMLVAGYTNPICKWCTAEWRKTGAWPAVKPPPAWESREMMRRRLMQEFGLAEYKQFGITHQAPYRLSIAHREAIRRGVIKSRERKGKL